MKETYEKTESFDDMDKREKASAFDSLIHSQHVNGNIVPGLDVEDLRGEFEEKLETQSKVERFR